MKKPFHSGIAVSQACINLVCRQDLQPIKSFEKTMCDKKKDNEKVHIPRVSKKDSFEQLGQGPGHCLVTEVAAHVSK